jgi:hypothetical protein
LPEFHICDLSCKQKFRKAAEAYTGEKDEKTIFDNVLTPLAKEYGLSATFEEFKEYAGAFSCGTDGELSEDELSQVAESNTNHSYQIKRPQHLASPGAAAFFCLLFSLN